MIKKDTKNTTPISNNGGTQIITSIMDKIITMVRENGIMGSFFVLLMVIVVYTMIFNPQIINMLIEKQINMGRDEVENTHAMGIEYRNKMNQQIPIILEQLIKNTQAERGMLLETHNGGSSIIGLPFLKISATYEILSYRYQNNPNQVYLLKEYKDEPVSLYQNLFTQIIERKYLLFNDITKYEGVIDNYIYKRLLLNNVSSAFFAGIFDVNTGSLIGIVVITSDKKNVFISEKIASEMVARIQVISYHLNVFKDMVSNNFYENL